jgi:peptide/nickel transport system substrate-binding protein
MFVLRVMDSHDIPGALIDGEVDVAEGVDKTNILAQVDDGSLVYGNPKLNRMRYLVFNTNVAPLNDVRVRRALFMALDREDINRVTTGAYGEVAIGTHPPLSIAYAPDDIAEQFEYDPVGAREALAQAGWVDSDGDGIVDKDGTQLRIELLTNAEMPQADRMLFALSEYWQEIGVEATYSQPARWDSVMEHIRRGGSDLNFDVMIRNLRWDRSGNQSDLFSGDPLGGSNLMGWSNADYDRLNKLQQHECDPVKRRELLIEMSNLVWNDVPVGVLTFIGASTAYSPLLHNFEFHDDTFWSLPFVWKEAASP